MDKNLKEKYRQAMGLAWSSQKMVDYCTNNCDEIIEFADGRLVNIDKRPIEKDFCFGYSDSAYDTKDFDRANSMAHHARTNEMYFIRRNLDGYRDMLKSLHDDRLVWYTVPHYNGQKPECKAHALCCRKLWDSPRFDDEMILSPEEKEIMIDAYKAVARKHLKQVKTYLKRYGLSKVNSWSYWKDA